MNKRIINYLKPLLIFASVVMLINPGLSMAADSGDQKEVSSESSAGEEFQKVVTAIRSKNRTMEPEQAAEFSEEKLAEFIEKYPDSPEAVQARMGIGQIYLGVGNSKKAIEQFKMTLEGDITLSEDNIKAARWFLSKAYLKNEDFDKAEELLKKIAGEAEGSDEKMLAAARNDLERIETLKKLTVGSPAISFPDTTRDISGENISLKEFKGKVVLLDFWATWCQPCMIEMPNVIKTYNKYHDQGFEIIGISLDKDIDKLKGYIKENDISWRQIFGGYWKAPIAGIYAVNSIPSTFLIGTDGAIIAKNMRGDELEEAVRKGLGKE
ncbi:MAG: thioredoxin-like domain-containing protein [Candidatus Krumholzibacteriota bacterium]|nr:thioredoxin-like domain-containing protein [Candidatus Krumholzibacteriota bacterium]